ncbi:hypothetical protein [Ostreibacterium oceani]|uniref:IPTL-CTERM protein sorting domain-containing protein n=1 Tax=Ostreibacterium oceani TaxID=2654998 RepID=A0A6N7EVI1_9GAMM|nr:hypothetical protein [Ostreibacterium oceani]MPV86774.1 hypothetical protein [Ostreibacterium oceani]
MKNINNVVVRWVIGAFFMLSAMQGYAQVNILVATTMESRNDGILATNNLYAEFSSDASWTVTDARNTLGALATVPTPDFSGYDVVVIGATYYGLAPDEMATLQAAIDSQASTSFVLFFDGCCGNGGVSTENINNLVSVVNNTFDPSVIGGTGAFVNNGIENFVLTASPLAASFPGVIRGGAYSPFTGVPDGNVIYRSGDGNDVGFIIPITESVGACVFSMADVSPFNAMAYPSNQGNIGAAFVDAATNPQGSCFLRSTPLPRSVTALNWWSLLVSMMLVFAGVHRYYRNRSCNANS